METYFDSAEGIMISRARAVKEVMNHGHIDTAEFDAEVKPHANGEYDAQTVLIWLGY